MTKPTDLDKQIDGLTLMIHFKENGIPSIHAGKITDKSKAIIKSLIAKAQTEARIDELIMFIAKLDEQDPYKPLKGTVKQYVEETAKDRIEELKRGKV